MTAIPKGLTQRDLPIAPNKWLPLLTEFEERFVKDFDNTQFAKVLNRAKEGFEGWSVGQFMFVVRATSLRSIGALEELFNELDQLEAGRRDYYLAALREPYTGSQMMVQSAWLEDSRTGVVDGLAAAQRYFKMARTAET